MVIGWSNSDHRIQVAPLGHGVFLYYIKSDEIFSDSDLELKSRSALERSKALKAPLRKSEFVRSRYLMRHVLGLDQDVETQGLESGPLLWPSHIVGSLSHKEGHVFLALSQRSASLQTLGLDLEKYAVNRQILQKICDPEEVTLLDSCRGDHSWEELTTFVFSAKESLYKAVYPLIETFFWFDGAKVSGLQFEDCDQKPMHSRNLFQMQLKLSDKLQDLILPRIEKNMQKTPKNLRFNVFGSSLEVDKRQYIVTMTGVGAPFLF
jgi:4'-phosphopantetheinyl transferase EntD